MLCGRLEWFKEETELKCQIRWHISLWEGQVPCPLLTCPRSTLTKQLSGDWVNMRKRLPKHWGLHVWLWQIFSPAKTIALTLMELRYRKRVRAVKWWRKHLLSLLSGFLSSPEPFMALPFILKKLLSGPHHSMQIWFFPILLKAFWDWRI